MTRRGAQIAFWPHTVRAWWWTIDRALAPADVIHACGSLCIRPALRLADRSRKAGRNPVVVYDVVDVVFESNNVLDMPRLARRWHARRERGWARRADAVVTVNDGLAEGLDRNWRPRRAVRVIPNWQEVPAALPDRSNRIREAIGVGDETRIVLFQGRLSPRLGITETAEAVLLVPDAAFVLIGFGRWLDRCIARDSDPRFKGRHFTLPAKHPDELLSWTASADVSVVPFQPSSLNQRLSSPTKFWESLMAGTPVVVPRSLTIMTKLIEEHDLGAVAESNKPPDLAAAICRVLDQPSDVRSAQRQRIARLAREQFTWPAAAARYSEVIRTAIADRAGRGRR